jgi:hypothetical protein
MTFPNIGGIAPLGIILQPSASITRPADTTAYTAGDLVANSTTAGSVSYGSLLVARSRTSMTQIRRAKLEKSGTSVTSAEFRVHLYSSLPTFANGDNAAFSTTRAGYLGALNVTINQVFSDGSAGFGVPVNGVEICDTGSNGETTVFWALEALNAYTPVSAEVFTLTLDAHPL